MEINDKRTRLSVTGLCKSNLFCLFGFFFVYWMFDVTVDDISVIYMMAHRFAGGLKRPVLVLGLQKLFSS